MCFRKYRQQVKDYVDNIEFISVYHKKPTGTFNVKLECTIILVKTLDFLNVKVLDRL